MVLEFKDIGLKGDEKDLWVGKGSERAGKGI